MKCSSTATECDKILLMAHSMALENPASGGAIPAPAGARHRQLTTEQRDMLSSIIAVLTRGCGVPGACFESLERRLEGPMSRMLPALQQGLAALDSACAEKTGHRILDLPESERGKFVRELRSGHKLTAFFQLIASAAASH